MASLLHAHFGVERERVLPHTLLCELAPDSLTLAEFLAAVEDRLGLRLPEPRRGIDTVADLSDALARALPREFG